MTRPRSVVDNGSRICVCGDVVGPEERHNDSANAPRREGKTVGSLDGAPWMCPECSSDADGCYCAEDAEAAEKVAP